LKKVMSTEVCQVGTQIGQGELFWDAPPSIELTSSAIGESLYLLCFEGRNEDLRVQSDEPFQLTPRLTRFLSNVTAEGVAWPYQHFEHSLHELIRTRCEATAEL
jgi:hypothetical protein